MYQLTNTSPMSSLEELFCAVDDFCQAFEPRWQQQLLHDGLRRRSRTRQLCLSEIMTILIAFHQSHYRNFKAFYVQQVSLHWHKEFPRLVSYNRFVEWIPSTLLPLSVYLYSCFGRCSGISLMDSTSVRVCHNRRIQQHRVFALFSFSWKNFRRLVFWLQVALGLQRLWRVVEHDADTRKY